MAWTDTIPCSFCGKEIPIFRKFGNGQFCSKAHQEAFDKQQEQMAVELLHRTHDALKAYRPVGSSIEDILGLPSAKQASQFSNAVAPATKTGVVNEPMPVPAPSAPPPAPPKDDSREFDHASPAVFARLAGSAPEKPAQEKPAPAPQAPRPAAKNSGPLHFGDPLPKLQPSKSGSARTGILSSLGRMLASLWPSRLSQKA